MVGAWPLGNRTLYLDCERRWIGGGGLFGDPLTHCAHNHGPGRLLRAKETIAADSAAWMQRSRCHGGGGGGGGACQAAGLCTLALTLLLLLLLLPGTEANDEAVSTDEAIMRKLRKSVLGSDPSWAAGEGWQPENAAHPCTWQGVSCNADQRITQLSLWSQRKSGPAGPLVTGAIPVGVGQLLPELANLPALKALDIAYFCSGSQHCFPGLPAQWFRRGAFPSLRTLRVTYGKVLLAPGPRQPPQPCTLPVAQPGALPLLQWLELDLHDAACTLPASWGGRRDVLPALRTLGLTLGVRGVLPAAWAGGFASLQDLLLKDSALSGVRPPSHSPLAALPGSGSGGAGRGAVPPSASERRLLPPTPPQDAASPAAPTAMAAAAAAAAEEEAGEGGVAPTALPPQWAQGFPKLRSLTLILPQLTGTFPTSWEGGGFPQLETLRIMDAKLSGTLPQGVFDLHPLLTHLSLDRQQLTGTLPPSWAFSQARSILVSDNALSGDAFPAAWLDPGSLPNLETLDVAGNPQLAGSLPASMPWPHLRALDVRWTGVGGRVQEGWCTAPFAPTFQQLWVVGSQATTAVPACAQSALPDLGIDGSSPFYTATSLQTGIGQPAAAAGGGGGTSQAVVVSLAVVLPVAAAAVVGAGGWALWRQRQRKQRAEQQRRDLESLRQRFDRWQQRKQRPGRVAPCTAGKEAAPPAATAAAAAEACEAGLAGQSTAGGHDADGYPSAGAAEEGGGSQMDGSGPRRMRLAAIIRTHFRQGHLSLEGVPLDALPATWAHQLGADQQQREQQQGEQQQREQQQGEQQQGEQQQREQRQGEQQRGHLPPPPAPLPRAAALGSGAAGSASPGSPFSAASELPQGVPHPSLPLQGFSHQGLPLQPAGQQQEQQPQPEEEEEEEGEEEGGRGAPSERRTLLPKGSPQSAQLSPAVASGASAMSSPAGRWVGSPGARRAASLPAQHGGSQEIELLTQAGSAPLPQHRASGPYTP